MTKKSRLLLVAMLGLAGCSGVIVAMDRGVCTTLRTVETTRQAGHGLTTKTSVSRVCAPWVGDPIGDLLLRTPR